MFETCLIRGRRFAPARFCAPLAGYTHSAIRRLLAAWGGQGALWTEMLAARQVRSENFATSPWLRRRPAEGFVFYQLMARQGDPLDRVLDHLGAQGVEGLDLNLACNARTARACAAGSALFDDLAALRVVVADARRHWPGILTAKIRLGHDRPNWMVPFTARLQLLADEGVDAIVLHPRFFEEKFKRRARLELIPWAASLTRLPLVANGDITGPEHVAAHAADLQPAAAIMLGRMAVARPGVFAHWDRAAPVDLAGVWRTLHDFVVEDFPPAVALRRLQMFTRYFAANFKFGHQFHVAVQNAASLAEARARADDFLACSPALVSQPALGLI